VHALFDANDTNTLSLIVFDTLEVNYQCYHEVGLLRSSDAESALETRVGRSTSREDDGIDVATLCKMRDIQYSISFLAPICDMRRFTWEEEEEIRLEKKESSRATPSVYYDRSGRPFRKIIVQPILQAERDGTCKSRALAALGWLLDLDEATLAWYVTSRELFQAELRAMRKCMGAQMLANSNYLEADVDDQSTVFGSLMSTGRRDKFGRDTYMRVSHVDTVWYNDNVERGCVATTKRRCLPDQGTRSLLLPSDSPEVVLQRKRQAEIDRIREVLGASDEKDETSHTESGNSDLSMQRWRAINDHEARWHFLEDTCFFGHNLGFRRIKKLYPRDDILAKQSNLGAVDTLRRHGVRSKMVLDENLGFGSTKYLRKYMVASYVTHEADPLFHEPVENFFTFLCADVEETVVVPFFVLPFPGCFVALSLEDHVKSTNMMLDLKGHPDEHIRQRVSDFSIPKGNSFMNDPISYNKTCSVATLPVKLTG